jgi:hypothetical protein
MIETTESTERVGALPRVRGTTFGRRLAAFQGAYYLSTGVWPIVHMRSFEAVTGKKIERWLVKTVGLLASAIGLTLLASARRRGRLSADARLLGIASAAGFAAVDLWYGGARRRISPIYLLDGAAEVAVAALWLLAPAR